MFQERQKDQHSGKRWVIRLEKRLRTCSCMIQGSSEENGVIPTRTGVVFGLEFRR